MIVIPMAGASRRFAEAGYTRPKYELMLDGRTVFAHAVGSFSAYFADTPFLFIVGAMPGAAKFVEAACRELGVLDARVAVLKGMTAGQAETVEQGLMAAGVGDDEPLSIFNIDTFRPGFRFPEGDWFSPPMQAKRSGGGGPRSGGGGKPAPQTSVDGPESPFRHVASQELRAAPPPPQAGEETCSAGWLEVFRGSGANWSYVRPADGPDPLALETAEKQPISDLCCTGLYHFARAADFTWALDRERAAPQAGELYVAPLYNHLIGAGKRVHYRLIGRSEVVFCGTPEEYVGLGGTGPET